MSFGSAETNAADGRTVAHYLVPRTISHLQHAKMHERAFASEAKLAKYEENERRRQATALSAEREQEKLPKVEEAALIISP